MTIGGKHPDLYLSEADKPYVFRDLDDMSPGISRLVFMLDYTRSVTLRAVHGLSISQLDTQVLTQGNTIALLLAHVAEVERFYQTVTFREQRPSGRAAESVFSESGRTRFRGRDLEHYLGMLRTARVETLRELSRRDDRWLHREYRPWQHDKIANNFFCWFHVLEDELRHSGRIAVLRKELELRGAA